jgi:hypothetical protein
MMSTTEECIKAMLYVQARLKEIKAGTGNSGPIINEVIGYIDGFTGFVKYPEAKAPKAAHPSMEKR